jgi:hypothetical protein
MMRSPIDLMKKSIAAFVADDALRRGAALFVPATRAGRL